MLQMLRDNRGNVPSPNRNEIMKLLNDAKKGMNINESSECRSAWVTNAHYGPEDYLDSEKIFSLAGETMKSFR